MGSIIGRLRRRVVQGDQGDTLIEVLLALLIISITAVAILTSFQTAIGASAEESHLAQLNTVLKSYAEVAVADIQEDNNFVSCASTTTYTTTVGSVSALLTTTLTSAQKLLGLTALTAPPTGYAASVQSVSYWNGTIFSSLGCSTSSAEPELITIKATGPSSSTETLSFVVSQFSYVAPPQIAAQFSVSSPYVLTEAVGSAFSYTLTTSQGSPVPVLTDNSLPSGVTFSDNGDGTGTLSGTSAVASGTYNITFTATNSVGSPAVLTFDLVVATPPVFTSASTVSYAAGAHVNFTVSATDTDSQPPALALDSTLTGAVKNLNFIDNGDGTGTLSGTLVSGSTGTYSLVFEADNSVGVATTQTVTFTIPTVPIFTSASSVSWAAGTSVNWTVSATDTDSKSPVMAVGTLSGVERNLTFVNHGNGTGTLSGTLYAGTGTSTVSFTATNSAGQVTTQTFTVTVPTAPVFTSSSSISYVAGSHISFTISASDTDTVSPTLTLSSLSGDPALTGLTFVNNGNGTGTLSGTLVSGKTGVYTLTATATNSAGQSVNQTLTLAVPTIPTFSGTTSYTAVWGTTVNWTGITSSDTDSQSPTLTLSSLSGDAALKNLIFTNNGNGTATITGTLVSGDHGTYTATVTSTNSAGQTATETITFTINT